MKSMGALPLSKMDIGSSSRITKARVIMKLEEDRNVNQWKNRLADVSGLCQRGEHSPQSTGLERGSFAAHSAAHKECLSKRGGVASTPNAQESYFHDVGNEHSLLPGCRWLVWGSFKERVFGVF